ncbi:MAG: type II toxin-antitoxin system Phd/YefM family antitoxin [Candidatus Dormibacteraceae bacterium]
MAGCRDRARGGGQAIEVGGRLLLDARRLVDVPTIGVRDLQRNPGRVLDEIKRTGRPAFVTRHGQPAAVMLPVDQDALEDYVLANAPEYVASMEAADEDGRAGRVRAAADVIAEIEAEEPAKRG